MFSNYLKIAWRSLRKHKLFSIINICGLSIGIASSLLLLSYAAFQFSYDHFHAKKDNIYRVNLDLYQNNQLIFRSAENYSATGPALKRDFPEVADQARLYNMGYKNNCVFTYNETHFRETKFLYADASFLTIFSFPFLQGDTRTALAEPFSAVISASTAKKIFGNSNPVGKFLKMDDDDRNAELCKVTGVFKDIPENSHLQFNILISYKTLYNRGDGINRFEKAWKWKDFYTYVLLRPGTIPAELEAKLPAFIARHNPMEQSDHVLSRLSLEPLAKIHLTSNLVDEPEPTGNAKAVGFLMLVSLFIITIAWVNYINLSTAGAVSRAKETGIRKLLGSSRGQLIRQFLAESLSVNLVSLVIALLLVQVFQSFQGQFFHSVFAPANLFSNPYGLLFVAFMILGAFFSGLYPAFILSSFKPVSVLKGQFKGSKKGLVLRKSLVIFQFSLSILLISGTFIVYQQVHYMLDKDLGIRPAQVMVLDRPGRWDSARAMHNLYVERFKETVLNNPGVESVGMSDEIPGKEIRNPETYSLSNAETEDPLPIKTTTVDTGYFHTLGMHFLAGRNFSTSYKTDGHALVLTASAVKLFGFRDPQEAIGKTLLSDKVPYAIIGVINDFHQLSLDQKMEPSAFQFNGNDAREFEYYLVRVKTAGTKNAISDIQAAWEESFKANPFGFYFLDTYFDRQYQNEIRFGLLFGSFSLIAIAIACIGLFALVSFMVVQRTKEIGVRKVLGAGLADLILLLTKDFIKLVVIANLVAWPLGWLLMNNWLKDFAYRIDLRIWVFLVAGFAALVIAMVTIGFQAIKAATANPVSSLRTE